MAKTNNPMMTRFTTGKIRLTYAFLWAPRTSENEDEDMKEDKGEKYSTCILIPKNDQATIDKLNAALTYAVQQGQSKGLWGATLPTTFKWPLRDGDEEYLEKGEEYKGHWFLNASSIRKPRIVDIARNDIYDENEVYSGCYARACINLYPFSRKGNKGIGCGLEAIQKICDGEPLGLAPLNVDEAFGDSEAYLADAGYAQPANLPPQQAPVQQMPHGYAGPQMSTYQQTTAPMQAPQVQGYPQQATPAPVPQAQSYPQQAALVSAAVQSPMQPPVNTFANNVAVADSILPPQLFGAGNRVA